MSSGTEFCARCQSYQNTSLTTSERIEVDAEGNPHKIVTTSYHCQRCSSFLRSEDVKAADQVSSVMEFCTRCQSVQNTQVTFSERVEVDDEGNAHKIITTSYHCEKCGSFLQSVDVEAAEQVGDNKRAR